MTQKKKGRKTRPLYKDPVLIITLFTMIGSSLISFFLVNENSDKINIISSQINEKKATIRELSHNVNQKRSQIDALVLLNLMTDKDDKKINKVKEKYLQIIPNISLESSTVEILEEFDKYRYKNFDHINDIYIEQIDLEQEEYELEQKNKIYISLATFLQVISLALIVIRDQRR